MICCYEMRKGRGSCVEPSSLKNLGSMFDAEAIHAQIPSNIEPNYHELLRPVSPRSFPNEQPATYSLQPVSESEWIVLFSERCIHRANARRRDLPFRPLNVP